MHPCLLDPCDFVQFIATNHANYATFSQSNEKAVINVATDWYDGKQKAATGQSHYDTGYIGKGSTKIAIYVCMSILYA